MKENILSDRLVFEPTIEGMKIEVLDCLNEKLSSATLTWDDWDKVVKATTEKRKEFNK